MKALILTILTLTVIMVSPSMAMDNADGMHEKTDGMHEKTDGMKMGTEEKMK